MDKHDVSALAGVQVNKNYTPESISPYDDNVSKSSDRKPKKRKIPKSCYFCRKRKLKCDHERPKCNQCNSRKLPDCVYMDTYNYEISSSDILADAPSDVLLKKISDLEQEILKIKNHTPNSNYSPDTDLVNTGSVNDLNDLFFSELPNSHNSVDYISEKPFNFNHFYIVYGSNKFSIFYGPTSWKTVISFSSEVYNTDYKKLSQFLQPMMQSWKELNNIRNETVECSFLNSVLIQNNNKSYFQLMNDDLPPYSEIMKCIDTFFDSSIYQLFAIMDKDKVCQDFRNSIEVIDPKTEKVTLSTSQNNYYAIGIILFIIKFTKYKLRVPPYIEKFFILLRGSTDYHLNRIEKLQFLFLNYMSHVYFPEDWISGRDTADEVMHICNCVISAGFFDLDKWYEKQSFDNVGSLSSLRNLWYHILLADVLTSLDCGKTVCLDNRLIDVKYFIPDYTASSEKTNKRINLLKIFLKISRSYIDEVNCRRSSARISMHVSNIVNFIDTSFKPLKQYINFDSENCDNKLEIDDFEYLILSPSISLLINAHSIVNLCKPENSSILVSALCKYIVVGLSLCKKVILTLYQRHQNAIKNSDISNLPNIILDEREPNLNLFTLITNSLLMRVFSEGFGLFFLHLTTINRNWIDRDRSSTLFDDSLESIRILQSSTLSVKSTVDNFFSLTDSMTPESDSQLSDLISKSFFLFVSLTFERFSRTLFNKGIESRLKNEKSLDEENIDITSLSKEQLDKIEKDIYADYLQLTQQTWECEFPSLCTDVNNYTF